ncbi:hypothetical protein HPB52_001426 [Rhipicephalus sanguineus]|uniref:Reverse transcriptase domain-containing protein n=1 Tax=Rhipicephalus sanguineus TaxID=34632 RepID=A0A9D4SVE6_RHISA|nr:hypothetical protein HPB52_001426 [Rhipicephalus sanguineus]
MKQALDTLAREPGSPDHGATCPDIPDLDPGVIRSDHRHNGPDPAAEEAARRRKKRPSRVSLTLGKLASEDRSMGSVGTPQGSVISPMFFNFTMGRPEHLNAIEEVHYTTYSEDITIWVCERRNQAAATSSG